MMRKKLYILYIIAFIMGGCYEDKGNYDYKNINDILSLTFSPEPTISEYSYDYKYRQPPLDTLFVTYSPSVEQSIMTDDSQLEFQWIFLKSANNKTYYDTVKSKDLILKYPPKKSTSYSPLFRMIDHSTGVEYYRQFTMKTELPFVMSWFVLHGQPNDRKLGVIEGIDDESAIRITLDAYDDIWGVRRFQKAIGLVYAPSDASNNFRTQDVEHLTVLQQDSAAYMHPFNLIVSNKFEQMMPATIVRPRLAYGMGDEKRDRTVIVDENGRLYWAKGYGYYFAVNTEEATKDYIVDKIYIAEDLYVIVWDKVHKQFMYYGMYQNSSTFQDPGSHPNDDGNVAVLKLFEEGVFDEKEWDDKEIIYLGQGNNDVSEFGVTAVAVDANQKHFVYQMGFNSKSGGSESFIEVTKTEALNMNLDENSQIATSIAFKDQIFYTRNSAVYLYNMVSGEETYLYDAGGPISQIKFRISRGYDTGYGAIDANNRLAIVVNGADGTGELHELFLDISGDVNKTMVYTGFGPIVDIVFSAQGFPRN